MKRTILTPAEYRSMPWKNGMGITHEIAISRSDEDLVSGSFLWRLSMAEVGTSSPFSLFPGCDRTIVLLEGNGMVLDSGPDGYHVLSHPFVPYSFSGEWQTQGRLLDGPCRDFNVMWDRKRLSAQCSVIALSNTPQPLILSGTDHALFTLYGDVQILSRPSLPGQVLPARHTLLTESGRALGSAAEQSSVLAVKAQEEEALLLSISMMRRPP